MFERFFNKPKVCKFESSNSDCSLIQQLKEKQTELKETDIQIKNLREGTLKDVTPKFSQFLIALEQYGFKMDKDYYNYAWMYNDTAMKHMVTNHGTDRLEQVLNRFSVEDIDNICNELKMTQNKAITLADLESKQEKLVNEIAEIKNKLGIE